MIKRWFPFATVLTALIWSTGGCGQGMAIDAGERAERHRKIAEYDEQQFNDDWDLFWLNDDISRLSMWRVR